MVAILRLFSSDSLPHVSLLSLLVLCFSPSIFCLFFLLWLPSTLSRLPFFFSYLAYRDRFQPVLSVKELVLLSWFTPRFVIIIIMTRSLTDQNISWSRVIVLGRIMAPQRYQILILGKCKCYLICKKSLCSCKQTNDFEMGKLYWTVQIKCHDKREAESGLMHTHEEKIVKIEQRENWRHWPWKLEWCGHRARNASSPQKLDGLKQMLPCSLWIKYSLRDIVTSVIPVLDLATRTVRKYIFVVLSCSCCSNLFQQPWKTNAFMFLVCSLHD